MAWAIAAAFCAAALILFFQHRALSTLDAQTGVILRQISDQTAADIAAEVREMLDGPVFDTLTAVNHPELRAGRLDLVAERYEEGLAAYPHVERFFVWSTETEAQFPGEALFYDRNTTRHARQSKLKAPFSRDPPLGRTILALAAQYAPEQRIYVAGETGGSAPARHVLLRLFWTEAERVEYFAVLGLVVDPAHMGQELFSGLAARSVGSLLQRRGGNLGLRLHVTDERGMSVYGQPESQAPMAASVMPFPMLFYPLDRIGTRVAGAVPPRPWRIEVSAPRAVNLLGVNQGYWPTILSVMLMLVALALTVQANRRAADLARMQADFISHVSHQLKTPLSLLSAVTETVTMDRVRSPEKLAEYLGIIRGEVSRLAVLVKRILEFSRLEQPRGYEFETVDLTTLVRETVAAFEASLSKLQFVFTVDQRVAVLPVVADPAAIEQALINLLDNAVKYSGESRAITVRVDAADAQAVIEVADNGIGIGDADQRRIFEKFYRGSGVPHHIDGFGLGLPIAQQLVHAHRGRLEFTSAPGRGSTFRLLLPLTAAARSDVSVAPGTLTDVEVSR
jgi:signal transduction histidine kinase